MGFTLNQSLKADDYLISLRLHTCHVQTEFSSDWIIKI